jgi:hypothetical protein
MSSLEPYTVGVSLITRPQSTLVYVIVCMVCWCLLVLGSGIGLHSYVLAAPTNEQARRVQNVQLWFGTLGFVGTLAMGCFVIIVGYVLLYVSFFSRLMGLDVQRFMLYVRGVSERFMDDSNFDVLTKVFGIQQSTV